MEAIWKRNAKAWQVLRWRSCAALLQECASVEGRETAMRGDTYALVRYGSSSRWLKNHGLQWTYKKMVIALLSNTPRISMAEEVRKKRIFSKQRRHFLSEQGTFDSKIENSYFSATETWSSTLRSKPTAWYDKEGCAPFHSRDHVALNSRLTTFAIRRRKKGIDMESFSNRKSTTVDNREAPILFKTHLLR